MQGIRVQGAPDIDYAIQKRSVYYQILVKCKYRIAIIIILIKMVILGLFKLNIKSRENNSWFIKV